MKASPRSQALALSSLLRSVLEDAGADESTVLLLDVPGQEGALLDSLRDELGALAAVIVRRCALPLPGAADWPTLQEQMRDRSFELVGHGMTRAAMAGGRLQA